MAYLLRQLIAGPRIKHPDANLDLCYVTPFLIATSGPSGTYPQRAYRNPLDHLLTFLDKRHGEEWCIWEFRAEGTGYPDKEVRGKVRHYPFPDHHPPPFAMIPLVMASMRNWLSEGADAEAAKSGATGKHKTGKLDQKHNKGRVVVVHCKAGKGRSGTMASAYLVSQCGWTKDEALARFTERRMRPGFGQGVSIPSQLRTVDYVERWTCGGKRYVERAVEILEVHVWGLRDGVKVAVEGFEEEGKRIKTVHVFRKKERLVVEGNTPGGSGFKDWIVDMANPATPAPSKSRTIPFHASASTAALPTAGNPPTGPGSGATTPKSDQASNAESDSEAGGRAVLFRPAQPLIVAGSDVNIDFERRHSTSKYGMVTSVAHVWFNAFFEGGGAEQDGVADETGVFEIRWEDMDGIKGSLRKGTRALDRMAVVWRFVGEKWGEVGEPGVGEVPEMRAADWKGGDGVADGRELGVRTGSPGKGDEDSVKGVKSSGPGGEEEIATEDVDAEDMDDAKDMDDDAKEVNLDELLKQDGGAGEPTPEEVNAGLDTASKTTPPPEEVNAGLDTASKTTPTPGSGETK